MSPKSRGIINSGEVFGWLTVLEHTGTLVSGDRVRNVYQVRCKCGKVFRIIQCNLVHKPPEGIQKSCSCFKRKWEFDKADLILRVLRYLDAKKNATTVDIQAIIFDKYVEGSLVDRTFARHFLISNMEKKGLINRLGWYKELSGQNSILWGLV